MTFPFIVNLLKKTKNNILYYNSNCKSIYANYNHSKKKVSFNNQITDFVMEIFLSLISRKFNKYFATNKNKYNINRRIR